VIPSKSISPNYSIWTKIYQETLVRIINIMRKSQEIKWIYIFHRHMYSLRTHEHSTALLHAETCSTHNFLIKLAILSLTVICQNGCFDAILKFTLFVDSPLYKSISWK
jgi:hypothetical protein